MKENYDFVVVGGGPAGIFFAYEMIKRNPNKRILIIEKGKRVESRVCPEANYGKCVKCNVCNITHGFSGAGAFSDGKLSLYNQEDDDFYVGGNLHKYIGVDDTKKIIDYTDEIYLKFGATTQIEGINHRAEIAKIRKKAEGSGLELINIPIRHLGTDKSHSLYQKIEEMLENAGVDILFETQVVDLIVKNNKIEGVKYEETKGKIKDIFCSIVILAVGRVGANWMLNICEKHKIKTLPGPMDIGIRYELPNLTMKDINKYLYEGKFIGKPNPYNDKVRTFCQNPSGFVTTEVYDEGVTLVNGHSCKELKSQNTNLAILVTINLDDVNPLEYAINIAKNINSLSKGGIIVQRLGDFKAGKRTWQEELKNNSVNPTLKAALAGDISLAMPYRIFKDIVAFIDSLDNVIPGFANPDNLMYGPEMKFYSNKVVLSKEFKTSVVGLYAIGDGCGLTRGLMMASASGVKLARCLE